MTLVDVAGWAGGLLVLVGYVLVSAQRMQSSSRAFQAMNVVGGVLLTCSAVQAQALPNLAINLVWIVAGSLTLAHDLKRRGARPATHAPAHEEAAPLPSERAADADPGGPADTLELPVLELPVLEAPRAAAA